MFVLFVMAVDIKSFLRNHYKASFEGKYDEALMYKKLQGEGNILTGSLK